MKLDQTTPVLKIERLSEYPATKDHKSFLFLFLFLPGPTNSTSFNLVDCIQTPHCNFPDDSRFSRSEGRIKRLSSPLLSSFSPVRLVSTELPCYGIYRQIFFIEFSEKYTHDLQGSPHSSCSTFRLAIPLLRHWCKPQPIINKNPSR